MSRLMLDANLLVVLMVGLREPDQVGQHKRTRAYSPEDFDLLKSLVDGADEVVVTTNVLTECSNLLRQTSEPAASELMQLLAMLIGQSEERYCPSLTASQHPDFPRLGLTDTAILESIGDDLPLLTVDLDLYLAAAAGSPTTVTNFNHLRPLLD